MASTLLVLRHGEAESFFARDRDSDRCLTDYGRHQVQMSVEHLGSQGMSPDLILVSPYTRTQQTSEYVKAAYPNAQVQTWPALVPESDPHALIELLQGLSEQTILLVSHQPLVSTLLGLLCGQSGSRFPMDTASLACVESELWAAGLAEMRWLKHAV